MSEYYFFPVLLLFKEVGIDHWFGLGVSSQLKGPNVCSAYLLRNLESLPAVYLTGELLWGILSKWYQGTLFAPKLVINPVTVQNLGGETL
ncbi:hypothetical protein QT397_07550 [Microbulbifer sp. MKSA007]|nr:hypothetical protein QT397_07550 [Microbulbifer sp. MKSA007]